MVEVVGEYCNMGPRQDTTVVTTRGWHVIYGKKAWRELKCRTLFANIRIPVILISKSTRRLDAVDWETFKGGVA